ILDRELGPVERRILFVQPRRGVVLLLRIVETSQVDAERSERVTVLPILAIQLDRLLVEGHDLLRLLLGDAEGGLRLAEERDRVRRICLRRLIEGLVRAIVIELAEGLFACG